jgi:hypothetical protein
MENVICNEICAHQEKITHINGWLEDVQKLEKFIIDLLAPAPPIWMLVSNGWEK